MKIRIIQFILIPLLLLSAAFGYSKENLKNNNLINFHDSLSVKNHKPLLIAHRGGVITVQSPECSIAAIHLAKQQGYAMVELDIRKSKDNVPIVFHDYSMKRACGIDKPVNSLNANEIVKINYLNTSQTICTLEQAIGVCRSLSLGLMLDIKVEGNEKFLQEIVNIIKKYAYENACITINGDPIFRKFLKEVALLTVTQEEFKKLQRGENCALHNKFWFGLPHQISDDMVKRLQQNGSYVIPAINTFRYPKKQHYELAEKDIQRLLEAGVDGYQIDSVYRPLFFEKHKKEHKPN